MNAPATELKFDAEVMKRQEQMDLIALTAVELELIGGGTANMNGL